MDETQVVQVLDGVAIESLLPQDPRVRIEHICIGARVRHYTYTAPVTGVAGGTVSGGGTAGGSYVVFDLGYDVANTSNEIMRVSMTLSEMTRDGYAVRDWQVETTVKPGDKRRVWAGLFVSVPQVEFKAYRVSRIAIGASGGSPSAITTPNKSVSEIFEVGGSPIRAPRQRRIFRWFVLALVALGALVAYLNQFLISYLASVGGTAVLVAVAVAVLRGLKALLKLLIRRS